MCEEKETYYYCGYCEFPTDHQGSPLELDNDEASDYLKEKRASDAIGVPVTGYCCTDNQIDLDVT